MGRLKWLFLLVGIGLLIWIIHRIGPGEILGSLRLLGWRLALPVFVFAPTYLFYTFAWRLILELAGTAVPFWRLCRIKMIGEAANTLTPINFAGGDPLRVWLLAPEVPATVGGTSAVVDRTLQLLASILLIAIGTLAALCKLNLTRQITWWLGGGVLFLTLLTFFFLLAQRRGFFERISRWASYLRIRNFSDKTLERLRDMDRQLVSFYSESPRIFWECLCFHFVARTFGIFEIFVLGRLMGISMDGWQALFCGTATPIANFFSVIVPGAMGITEGVVSGLFYLLGWSPADGVALQVARRLRSGFWIGVGFLFFLLHKRKKVA